MERAIAVIGYNRPLYLAETLKSLVPQCGMREVYFYLDGARSLAFFEDALAPDKEKAKRFHDREVVAVDQCAEIFQAIFPSGRLERASRNLGVAFNTRRMREEMFGKYNKPSIIVLEDDVVLQIYYIRQLEFMMDMFEHSHDVAMVSCFGEAHLTEGKNEPTSYEEQHKNRHNLVAMNHIWAYGMWRNRYKKLKDTLDGYYDLLPDEYRKRPDDEIKEWNRSLGFDNKHSSQDTATELSMLVNNMVKISTYTNNLKYIGEVGEHCHTEHFKNVGYDRYATYDQEVDLFCWDGMTRKKIWGQLTKRCNKI